jgi:hypothetical protein
MRIIFTLLISIVVASQTIAQITVPSYRFMQFQGTYSQLPGGTLLGSTTTDDQLYNPANIGGTSTSITGTGFPIGFNFLYEGVTYSSFMVSNNGFIKLGNGTFTIRSSLIDALSDSSASNGVDFNQVICGLHADLQSQAGASLSIHNLGTAPNRTLVVQFSGYRHYLSSGDVYNFQFRLNEADQSIEIVFGSFVKDATERTYTIGLRGTSQRSYNSRRVVQGVDTWITSRASTSVVQTCDLRQSFIPVSGLTYKFMPPVVSSNDLAVSNIYLGTGANDCSFSDNETIKVDVINFGENAQTSAVVSYRLNSGNFINRTVNYTPPLAQFQTYTIDFD